MTSLLAGIVPRRAGVTLLPIDIPRRLFLGAALGVLAAAPAFAQQPFATDDAEVTERGHFHLEYAH